MNFLVKYHFGPKRDRNRVNTTLDVGLANTWTPIEYTIPGRWPSFACLMRTNEVNQSEREKIKEGKLKRKK